MTRRPAHGGYPTPRYSESSARRRAESQRLYGHTGAWVTRAVEDSLDAAARTEKLNVVVTLETGEGSVPSPPSGGEADG